MPTGVAMKIPLLSAALLFLPFAASHPSESGSRGVRSDLCGLRGYQKGSSAYWYTTEASLASKDYCGARCVAEPICQSFAFSSKVCLLYNSTVYVQTPSYVHYSIYPDKLPILQCMQCKARR